MSSGIYPRKGPEESGLNEDIGVLKSFHYKQELQRTIRLFGSFAVAFSFISITTGIFTNYSFVLTTAGPAGIWTWPIVTVGQILVAMVFAELAGKMPLAGYSYQWVTRLTNPGLGWLTGWVAFAFLVLVVPAVDGGLAPVLAGILGIDPNPTNLMWIVIVTLLVQATLNIVGVSLASKINNAAVFTEAVGILGLTVVLGGIALFKTNASAGILVSHGNVHGSYLAPFLLSSLMGAFTLVGFEAPANLSEETVKARHTVPKAIMGSIILSGIMGTLFLIAATLAIPNLDEAIKSASPLPYVIESNLGPVFGTAFLVLVAVSIFACGLVIMTSASRLVYAMARDNVFLFSGVFRKVSEGSGVPVAAVVLILVLGTIATIYSSSLTLLVGATSVLPALIYLLTVVAYRFSKSPIVHTQSAFALGRWSSVVANAAIIWLLGVIAILTVPEQFHEVAKVSGLILLAGVIIYFALVRPRIVAGKAGIQIQDAGQDAVSAD